MSEHGWSPNSPDGRGRAAAEEPGDTVWRLRSRGCWQEAAELLRPAAEHDPAVALARAELLIEQCLFTASQWPQAEQALRLAEALAEGTEQRAAAACARGFLAYLASVLGPRDRLDEAQAALGRTSALLPPDAPGRPLLDFRRGLVAENLLRDRGAAWIAYRRAHEGAGERGDELLRSYTWRHLAALALSRGERGNAREGFDASLRLREQLGFTVGVAPALAALAEVSEPTEAVRLRAEAARLVHALGGVPVWLARQLSSTPPGGVRTPGSPPDGVPTPGPPPDGRITGETRGAIS
ncbi:hypothetical protein ABZX88_10910 [Kitasatospora aureofaciens]|uniref:hypothetical protein n=1 Tax=Kitasatospora aureofaciens TaxID=1894 RepID=UPI000A44F4AF|nr:hypothetical protein [Kitasatospora aureofaciens]HJD80587.1 hypothetical protein [Kitasatospora aureofaciens]